MYAIDALRSEHRVIEQVLSCLEKIADQCAKDGVLDGESARQAIDFLQNFADRCHHGKEEGRLFPIMEMRGVLRERGPIGVMLHEHDQGRQHIKVMVDSLRDAEREDLASCDTFSDHAHAYVRLLRDHIWKEDNRLFPMAEQTLTSEDRLSLEHSFEQVEAGEMGIGTHERYLNLANQLADRFGVALADLGRVPACSHCGHATR
jgi:hemerythrin-like domain-containing protein